MEAKIASPAEFFQTDADYLKGIDDCLKEMKAIRAEMKKMDERFDRSKASSNKYLAETRAVLRNVEKSL